ncbi:MAG TPA: nuclear transport factor 2 family protein, partial [Blastocatellia bacterium]
LTPLRWHKDSDSVFVMLREIAYASMRRDSKFFERVLDDDYVGVGPDGATRNKAEEIAEVNRLDSIKKFEFEDLRVSGDDHVAFATFLATVHFQNNGQDSTEQYRYTINFIKQDVPIDAKGEVELELFKHSAVTQASCSKCHSEKGLLKMPLVKVKEEIAREMNVGTAKPVGHGELIQLDVLLHQRQLKIAAIHMSRKQ